MEHDSTRLEELKLQYLHLHDGRSVVTELFEDGIIDGVTWQNASDALRVVMTVVDNEISILQVKLGL